MLQAVLDAERRQKRSSDRKRQETARNSTQPPQISRYAPKKKRAVAAVAKKEDHGNGGICGLDGGSDASKKENGHDGEEETEGDFFDPVPMHCARVSVADSIKWKSAINTRDVTLPHFLRSRRQCRRYIKDLMAIAKLNGIRGSVTNTGERVAGVDNKEAAAKVISSLEGPQISPADSYDDDGSGALLPPPVALTGKAPAQNYKENSLPQIAAPRPPPQPPAPSTPPHSTRKKQMPPRLSSPEPAAAHASICPSPLVDPHTPVKAKYRSQYFPERTTTGGLLPPTMGMFTPPPKNVEESVGGILMSPASRQLREWREGLARIAEDRERERKLIAILGKQGSTDGGGRGNEYHNQVALGKKERQPEEERPPPPPQEPQHPPTTNLWKWWEGECSHAFRCISVARLVQAWWRAQRPRHNLKVARCGVTKMAAIVRRQLQERRMVRGETVQESPLPTDAERSFLRFCCLGNVEKAQQCLAGAASPLTAERRLLRSYSSQHQFASSILMIPGGRGGRNRKGLQNDARGRPSHERVNPRCRNEHGHGAMALAARNGQLHVVRWLHESVGLSLCSKSDDGRTASELAVSQGHLHILQYMHGCCAGPSSSSSSSSDVRPGTTSSAAAAAAAAAAASTKKKKHAAAARVDWDRVALAAAARSESRSLLRWLATDDCGPKGQLSGGAAEALKARLRSL